MKLSYEETRGVLKVFLEKTEMAAKLMKEGMEARRSVGCSTRRRSRTRGHTFRLYLRMRYSGSPKSVLCTLELCCYRKLISIIFSGPVCL